MNTQSSSSKTGLAEKLGELRREARVETGVFLEHVVGMTNLGCWIWDEIEDRCVYCSDQLAGMNGISAEAYIAKRDTARGILNKIHPDDRARYDRIVSEATRLKQAYAVELREAGSGGRVRFFLEQGEPLFDARGNLLYTIGILRDITETKRIEDGLQTGKEYFRRVAEDSPVMLWETDGRGDLVFLNRASLEFLGLTAAELADWDLYESIHPGDRDQIRALELLDLSSPAPFQREYRLRHVDGRYRWVLDVGSPRLGPDGTFAGYSGYCIDITEQKEALADLRDREAWFHELFEDSPVSLRVEDWSRLKAMLDELARQGVTDFRGYFEDHPDRLREAYDLPTIEDVSREALRTYRADSKAALIAISGSQYADPEELAGFREQIARLFNGMTTFAYGAEETACDGTRIITRMRTAIPAKFRQSWSRVLVSIEDITERKKAESVLEARETQFRQAAEIAKLGYWSLDLATERLTVSPESAAILGVPQAELNGMTDAAYIERFVHPDDLERVRALNSLVERVSWRYDLEYRVLRPDGKVIWVREIGESTPREEGKAATEIGTFQDITDLKIAEENLRQVQKIEAMGQLTGGVAHDFNNLLAVIQGNAELLESKLDPGDRELLEAIIKSARRGSELTQRLLAFARRQPLRPKAVDLSELVESMLALLRRTLGESVLIETKMATAPCVALADPGQVEDALLNLAINARDAMPHGGRLTIETLSATPDATETIGGQEKIAGDLVVLGISDTGVGMPSEVMARAFEPFFTTKEVGKGSGLGMSMVYGFAKQSGGHVAIDSEEARGTTVKLYLPRAAAAEPRPEPRLGEPLRGQGEVVLVVEDDEDVRELVVRMLRQLGYEVIDAPGTRTARSLLAANRDIDVLLSDIVLPGGIGGPELAAEALEICPGLKVLLMSGYPATGASRDGFATPKAPLLRKPFTKQALSQMMRDVLDR